MIYICGIMERKGEKKKKVGIETSFSKSHKKAHKKVFLLLLLHNITYVVDRTSTYMYFPHTK